MKQLCLLIMTFLSVFCHAETLRGQNSSWQCAAFDSFNKQWLVKSSYQRKALNQAKADCVHQSKAPRSCTVAKEYCEMIVKGKRIQPHWQCLALDKMGKHWRSDTFRARNDAVIGARHLCQKQSTFPSSCYVRLLTCENKS